MINLMFKRNSIISRIEIHSLYKHTKNSYLVIRSLRNTPYINSTYLINNQKIAIIGNTSYTCLHQTQRLISVFRTLIYTHTTYLLRKFFLCSRFWKHIDTYISDLWIYMYVFQRIIKSTVFWAKTAVL